MLVTDFLKLSVVVEAEISKIFQHLGQIKLQLQKKMVDGLLAVIQLEKARLKSGAYAPVTARSNNTVC